MTVITKKTVWWLSISIQTPLFLLLSSHRILLPLAHHCTYCYFLFVVHFPWEIHSKIKISGCAGLHRRCGHHYRWCKTVATSEWIDIKLLIENVHGTELFLLPLVSWESYTEIYDSIEFFTNRISLPLENNKALNCQKKVHVCSANPYLPV